MLILSFALAYSGLAMVSLSLQRHYRDLRGVLPSSAMVRGLRLAGYPLAMAAILPCIAACSLTIGIVLWLGMLTGAAVTLVALMAWKPRLPVLLGPVLACLAGYVL
ncbi:MAG: DUF3325 domain-containing protein [Novosphingobium sp.]